MKLFALTLMASCFSLSAWATTWAVNDPTTFCPSVSSICSAPMVSITQDFAQHGQMTDFSAGNIASSGSCYYLNTMVAPDMENFGVVILAPNGGRPLFDASFGYFYPSDPWAGQSFDQLKQTLSQGGPGMVLTTSNGTDLMVDFPSQNSDIRYWMREYPEQKQILLISQWQFQGAASQFVFCRMGIH